MDGSQRSARRGACLIALSLLSLLAPGVGRDMEALYEPIDPGQPYFSWADPLLLYVRMPLAVLGALALVMTPGLILARSLRLASSLAEWLFLGFVLSLIGLSALAALVQGLLVRPLTGEGFAAVSIGASVLLALHAAWRRPGTDDPLADRRSRRELVVLTAAALLFVVALAPKFFWESFNGDGAHAFEASRLLLHQPLPFWPAGAGNVGVFPGLNSALFTWPNSWFLHLFGENEGGARLAFVLELAVLYAALVAVIETGRPGARLSGPARALIGLGLASYGLVMAYSATYDPYCSDIALPATQDTLLVVCFLGVVLAFERERTGWLALFCFLTLLASPAGPMLLGAWLVAVALGWRERRWPRLLRCAACVAAAFLASALLPHLLAALGLPAPGAEHRAGELLKKLRYVQLLDVQRLLFLIVPAGIYPVLGLFAWRRGDDLVRALIAAALLVFGFYYRIAFVSLHYFVPAMLLPLAIFWRDRLARPGAGPSRVALGACFALALGAVALGLPRSSAIYTAAREVGERIEVRGLDGYERLRPETLRASDLLVDLFTLGWLPEVPERAYAGSALSWNHYAHRARPVERPTYLLLGRSVGTGPGQALSRNEAVELYVLDPEAWQAQRTMRPTDCRGLHLYALPRAVLFARPEAHDRPGVLDLRAWIGKILPARAPGR